MLLTSAVRSAGDDRRDDTAQDARYVCPRQPQDSAFWSSSRHARSRRTARSESNDPRTTRTIRTIRTMNIVSVSWGDHLSFGEGDGRLDTPEKLRRRLPVWRDELGAGALHWRMLRSRIPGTYCGGSRLPSSRRRRQRGRLGWDDFTIVPAMAREAGLSPWLYVTVFDEGWPLASASTCVASAITTRCTGSTSRGRAILTRDHPQWLVSIAPDASGRRAWSRCRIPRRVVRSSIDGCVSSSRRSSTGLFVCLRSQSRPADTADQFGFNEPARRDFLERYGVDVTRESFDIQAWRDLLGSYLTALVSELRIALGRIGKRSGDRLRPRRRAGPAARQHDAAVARLGAPRPRRSSRHRSELVAVPVDVASAVADASRHGLRAELSRWHRNAATRRTPVIDVCARASPSSAVELFVARQWCERSR